MDEKINETKIAILDRISKAVKDETKSLSAETLAVMASIVKDFDFQEMQKAEPKYNEVISPYLDKLVDIVKPNQAVIDTTAVERSEI
jgi:cell division protein ZapA (FtsZ GTPase activity inhibitor)